MFYEYEERIRYSQTDDELKLTLTCLLDFFQDAATFQGESLDIGVHALTARGLAWFLAAWQIDVFRYPEYYEKVIIGTYPYQFHGCTGMRNFYLKTEQGELLAVADSTWALMDREKGRMCRIPEDIVSRYEMGEPLAMEYMGRRIELPETLEEGEAFPVRSQNLDSNGHVNNGQFVRLAMEHGGCEKNIKRLRVEYKHPAVLGEWITPAVSKKDGRTIVTLATNQLCTVVSME